MHGTSRGARPRGCHILGTSPSRAPSRQPEHALAAHARPRAVGPFDRRGLSTLGAESAGSPRAREPSSRDQRPWPLAAAMAILELWPNRPGGACDAQTTRRLVATSTRGAGRCRPVAAAATQRPGGVRSVSADGGRAHDGHRPNWSRPSAVPEGGVSARSTRGAFGQVERQCPPPSRARPRARRPR